VTTAPRPRPTPDELAKRLRERYPDVLVARGEVTMVNQVDELLSSLAFVRDAETLGFTFLSDVAATDWPGREPRFWVAYHLYSPGLGTRLRVKVGVVDGEPHVPSVTTLFPTADWLEREVYDFFGIVFDGHPDLRRIQMPDEWEGFPLRKDHPLAGVATQYHGASIPPPDERGA
jgi:NADH-quinone oxidoreductase subunit C